MPAHLQIITTVASQDEARRIAAALVERRLAACVQISGPIESHYRWQDRLETSQEWQCAAKTRSNLYSAVEQCLRELHSYQVPEILAFAVTEGNPDYLQWIDTETA